MCWHLSLIIVMSQYYTETELCSGEWTRVMIKKTCQHLSLIIVLSQIRITQKPSYAVVSDRRMKRCSVFAHPLLPLLTSKLTKNINGQYLCIGHKIFLLGIEWGNNSWVQLQGNSTKLALQISAWNASFIKACWLEHDPERHINTKLGLPHPTLGRKRPHNNFCEKNSLKFIPRAELILIWL